METITSLDTLLSKIKEAEEKQAISDDAFRESVSSWSLSPAIFGKCPTDPFSADFKAFQLTIYERLANKKYNVVNEETFFNFDHEMQWPYPYGTQSAKTVGTNLMGYGWLIQKMNLPPKARILEIGSGFGSLTVHLARMGYQVSCLDISEAFLNFIEKRTADFPEPVKTICGDMATAKIENTYDAVIFNASLHHSLEHKTVLERVGKVLTPDGIIAFTAEPVVTDDSIHVPYSWGVRLDGLSVWSIYKWGWLELGFQESYFVDLLTQGGWGLTRYNLGLSGHTDIWIASKNTPKQSAASSTSSAYATDPETELIRLRKLVEGYENGRFIRFTRWLKGHR